MGHLYTVERHTHGWLICAPPGQKGVPMNALGECQPLYGLGATIDPGIAHHYNALDLEKHACFAVTTKNGSAAWRDKIGEKVKNYDPQQRWWFGTDVGTSSAAIMGVLGDTRLRWTVSEAYKYGARSTPFDADDLGRCLRLLKAMPEWRGRLNEVAEAYPETAWPEIVAAWGELELADTRHQNAILNECHMSQKRRMS